MTPAKYMTKKEKKLYRRYLSELHITNLYQLTKLLIDILSCKNLRELYHCQRILQRNRRPTFCICFANLKKGL